MADYMENMCAIVEVHVTDL